MYPVNDGKISLSFINKTHTLTYYNFTGGFSTARGHFDTILRYNPSTDTWTEAGQLTEPKNNHASTTIADISQFDNICPWIVPWLEIILIILHLGILK